MVARLRVLLKQTLLRISDFDFRAEFTRATGHTCFLLNRLRACARRVKLISSQEDFQKVFVPLLEI